MSTIHVMIAEDERMAKRELTYLLEQEEDIEMYPGAESGDEIIHLYEQYEPDVLFLDVEMPGKTGIEAAREITAMAYLKPPLFIFTTAYDEYALDAFEIAAVDYLLKPYDDHRFQKTMERIRKRLALVEAEFIEKRQNQKITAQDKLLIDDGERMMVVAPKSIHYAVPHNRMLEIHTADKIIYSRLSLQELEKKLSGYSFFRTHRSYLVNLDFIEEITPWFNGTSNVTLKDKEQTKIPVSRAARKILLKHFNL